jgi:hypothetical protein
VSIGIAGTNCPMARLLAFLTRIPVPPWGVPHKAWIEAG